MCGRSTNNLTYEQIYHLYRLLAPKRPPQQGELDPKPRFNVAPSQMIPVLRLDNDGQPFSFAGLWERWEKGEEPLETCTIITGEPNSLAKEIHNRMPVIIAPEDYDAWLRASDTAIAQALLQPFPSQLMRYFPVSKRVNSPKNDDPSLIEPLAA